MEQKLRLTRRHFALICISSITHNNRLDSKDMETKNE
jgi:hypothetical protein